jgi:hypothetical protein
MILLLGQGVVIPTIAWWEAAFGMLVTTPEGIGGFLS